MSLLTAPIVVLPRGIKTPAAIAWDIEHDPFGCPYLRWPITKVRNGTGPYSTRLLGIELPISEVVSRQFDTDVMMAPYRLHGIGAADGRAPRIDGIGRLWIHERPWLGARVHADWLFLDFDNDDHKPWQSTDDAMRLVDRLVADPVVGRGAIWITRGGLRAAIPLSDSPDITGHADAIRLENRVKNLFRELVGRGIPVDEQCFNVGRLQRPPRGTREGVLQQLPVPVPEPSGFLRISDWPDTDADGRTPETAEAQRQAALAEARSRRASRGHDPLLVHNRAISYSQKCEPSIEGVNGNVNAFKAATSVMKAFDLDTTDTLDVLMSHWNMRCQPPWRASELYEIVENAASHVHRHGIPTGVGLDRPGPARMFSDGELAILAQLELEHHNSPEANWWDPPRTPETTETQDQEEDPPESPPRSDDQTPIEPATGGDVDHFSIQQLRESGRIENRATFADAPDDYDPQAGVERVIRRYMGDLCEPRLSFTCNLFTQPKTGHWIDIRAVSSMMLSKSRELLDDDTRPSRYPVAWKLRNHAAEVRVCNDCRQRRVATYRQCGRDGFIEDEQIQRFGWRCKHVHVCPRCSGALAWKMSQQLLYTMDRHRLHVAALSFMLRADGPESARKAVNNLMVTLRRRCGKRWLKVAFPCVSRSVWGNDDFQLPVLVVFGAPDGDFDGLMEAVSGMRHAPVLDPRPFIVPPDLEGHSAICSIVGNAVSGLPEWLVDMGRFMRGYAALKGFHRIRKDAAFNDIWVSLESQEESARPPGQNPGHDLLVVEMTQLSKRASSDQWAYSHVMRGINAQHAKAKALPAAVFAWKGIELGIEASDEIATRLSKSLWSGFSGSVFGRPDGILSPVELAETMVAAEARRLESLPLDQQADWRNTLDPIERRYA